MTQAQEKTQVNQKKMNPEMPTSQLFQVFQLLALVAWKLTSMSSWEMEMISSKEIEIELWPGEFVP